MQQIVSNKYQLRGHMVQPKTQEEIVLHAWRFFKDLKQYNISQNNIESIIDILAEPKFNISIHIERNANWDKKHSKFKQGESIPSKREITLPKRVIDGVIKNKREDLATLFHEIGHVLLKHEPVYQKSNGYIVSAKDDAEAQADSFAQAMLVFFNVQEERPTQLSLF